MGHWDSSQKVAVNVTDKLITLMSIPSTVFTCVSYIKYQTTLLCQNRTSKNVQNNLEDNMISMKPLCNNVIVLDKIFED